MRACVPLLTVALSLAALPVASGAQAPTTLPLNTVVTGELGTKGEKKLYRLTVNEAGILTLAGHSVADLVIAVTDAEGQVIVNGLIDRDVGSNLGSEYGSIIVPERGTYGVEVRMIDASGPITFTLGATYLPLESFRRAPDADARPSAARAVEIGTAVEDAVHADEYDRVDWYSVTARTATTVVLMTRVESGVRGDLAIEVFQNASLSESSSRSDQDQRGSEGNESVTIDIGPGETVRFRVVSLNERGTRMPYRLSVALVP